MMYSGDFKDFEFLWLRGERGCEDVWENDGFLD